MVDTVVNALAILIVVLFFYDWRIATWLGRAAWQRPRIPALTSSAVDRIGVAIGATAVAILSLSRLYSVATNDPVGFVPVEWSIWFLLLGVIAPSLPNIPKWRAIRRWTDLYRGTMGHHPLRRVGDQPHPFRRSTDRPHPQRRATDVVVQALHDVPPPPELPPA
jgi:hypothetical protein